MPYLIIAAIVVAFIHVAFFLVETLFWHTTIFGHNVGTDIKKKLGPLADLPDTWASNQGVYNLFIALGVVWGFLHPNAEFGRQLLGFFGSCVMAAGLWGAYSVDYPKFLLFQTLPGTILLLLAVFRPAN